jgi:hypothetical protein
MREEGITSQMLLINDDDIRILTEQPVHPSFTWHVPPDGGR